MAREQTISDPYEVKSSERGVVRVFTTDLDAEGSSAVTAANVHRLLGTNLDLDTSRIEVFPSTALEGMGLTLYLQEGYGVPKEDLRGTSAALDSLKGLVILVASGAFKGKLATLEPNPALRFVGLFREPAMAPPEPMIAPDTAKGPLESADRTAAATTGRGSAWPLAILFLICAAALVLFLLF